jgi:ribonuclease M5
MEKIKLNIPVITEGKYDKMTLSRVIDATVITTDGFGVFNSGEKRALIKRLSEKGIIVLCDSDGAGKLIRSHISSLVPKDKLYQLYTPRIEGKEKRKSDPGAEGILGVEGMTDTLLHEIFEKFLTRHPELTGDVVPNSGTITKLDFYEAGLSGGAGSSSRRDSLAESFGLPRGMTANALLDALNMIITRDEFIKATENAEE